MTTTTDNLQSLIRHATLSDDVDRLMIADMVEDEGQAALLRDLDNGVKYDPVNEKFLPHDDDEDECGSYHGGIDGFDIEMYGHVMCVTVDYDEYPEQPWDHECGHGPVSKWRDRGSKKSGERILASDYDRCLFYDIQEAQKIAIKDGWGPAKEGETKKQTAARAVEEDFQRLKAWCDDEWHYVCVNVNYRGESEHMCGIESDATEYIKEVAEELATELLRGIYTKD